MTTAAEKEVGILTSAVRAVEGLDDSIRAIPRDITLTFGNDDMAYRALRALESIADSLSTVARLVR